MAGTVERTDDRVEGVVRRADFLCVGDASDGSFPAVTLRALTTYIDGTIHAIQTNPGSPAPDDNYDITLVDGDGLDRLGGAALNRDASNSERVDIPGGALVSPNEDLTLTITGNATPEATMTVTIWYSPTAASSGLSFTDGAVDTHDADAVAELETIAGAVHMEDDPHVSTDSGVFLLGVRNDANASLTDTDGDYSPIRVSERGNVVIEGGVAHDAVDQGSPIKVGGRASATAPTGVADNDRVNLWLSQQGAAFMAALTATLADGASNIGSAPPNGSGLAYPSRVYPSVFNGSTWDRQRGDTNGAYANGNVAHDAVDAGNPIKIGGKARTTLPSVVAADDRVDAYFTAYGQLGVAALVTTQPTDGDTAYRQGSLTGSGIGALGAMLFNGTNWDRQRNNVDGTAIASAARTATTSSADITNHNARGIAVVLDVSAASGSGGLQVSIQAKDPVTGNYAALNSAPTAVTSTGTRVYELYPGAVGGGSGIAQVANVALPRTFRITVTHGDGSSYTYSVGYTLIV
jgi:hypothetical protein